MWAGVCVTAGGDGRPRRGVMSSPGEPGRSTAKCRVLKFRDTDAAVRAGQERSCHERTKYEETT